MYNVLVKKSDGKLNPSLEEMIKQEITTAVKAKEVMDKKMGYGIVAQRMVMRFPKLKAMIQDRLDQEGIKSVLTTKEIMKLSILNNGIARIEDVVKMAITPWERKMLRTAATFIEKTILSIYDRVRESTREEIKDYENTCFPVLVHKSEYEHLKKCIEYREEVIEEAWESMLNVASASMSKCCVNCTDDPLECDMYKEFDRHHLEECTGASYYKGKKCKYGYCRINGKVV